MNIKLFYSIQNCGDGSVYLRWWSSEELANWDEEHASEGWGESSIGSISISGDKIIHNINITTPEKYLFKKYYRTPEILEECKKFVKEIFNNVKFSNVEVKIIDNNYYGIYINTQLVYKIFRYPEDNTSNEGCFKCRENVFNFLKNYEMI